MPVKCQILTHEPQILVLSQLSNYYCIQACYVCKDVCKDLKTVFLYSFRSRKHFQPKMPPGNKCIDSQMYMILPVLLNCNSKKIHNVKTDALELAIILSLSWRKFAYHQCHGLRTPNEGKNQRNLKIWSAVADKIWLGCT